MLFTWSWQSTFKYLNIFIPGWWFIASSSQSTGVTAAKQMKTSLWWMETGLRMKTGLWETASYFVILWGTGNSWKNVEMSDHNFRHWAVALPATFCTWAKAMGIKGDTSHLRQGQPATGTCCCPRAGFCLTATKQRRQTQRWIAHCPWASHRALTQIITIVN